MATFRDGDHVGRGSFGDVFLTEDAITGELMVDKRLPIEHLLDEEQDAVKNEVNVMERLRHPHIVTLNGYKKTRSILHIYMEYMPGLDLAKLITEHCKTNETLAETTVISYLAQLLSAVGYMHKKKLAHRDLKPANILLSEDKQRLKVTDFGMSAACQSLASKHLTVLGTVSYMAPEVAEGKPYDYRCDIWSLGVIAYELAELKLPIRSHALPALLLKVQKGEIEPMRSRVGPALRGTILAMLKRESEQRPECRLLLQNAMFEDVPDISTLRIKEPTVAEVWEAANGGDLPRLKRLLEDSNGGALLDGLHETDMWLKRTTPLMAAAFGGHQRVVTWIISKNMAHVDTRGTIGTSAETGGMTALLLACRQGHVSVVDTLIDDGRADAGALDNDGTTAMMHAALGGHCDVIGGLIKRGRKVDDREAKNGKTALHYAAQGGNVPCIELLISEGAEVDANSNQQLTPLHLAAQYGHPSAILTLLQHDANMAARNFQQNSPLSMAALKGHLDVLRLLHEKGADINERGYQGKTLLHAAAQGGHVSAILFLLQAGCDVTATDHNGRTPKALAEAFSHREASHLLSR